MIKVLTPKGFDEVRKFIQKHKLAVLATVSPQGLPENAVVGFSMTDKFEIYFGTSMQARKYRNLLKNPRVAAVIGWDKGKTVQYEGEVYELSPEEAEEYTKTYTGDVPSLAKWGSKLDAVFYKITPKYIKYSDISRDPWEIVEF